MKKFFISFIVVSMSLIMFSGRVDASTAVTVTITDHFVTVNTTPGDTLWELPNPKCTRARQLIYHYAYTVSFNYVWHIPNWAAYELTAQETEGSLKRESTFKMDPKVKKGSADTKDYTKSGYDRGHMAPAADMRWSQTAMKESFYTSNICPQLHSLNAGDWKELEEKGRDWAKRYGKIYIACGPIMADTFETIGATGVAVPKAFFKVIFRVENGKYYGIGYIFPHDTGNYPLSHYAVSIDQVEKITGLDFFYQLPDKIENAMEAECRPKEWQ